MVVRDMPPIPRRHASDGPTPGLALAATYERHVAASVARVWENVLDWEHLPWLHARAFCGIEPIAASPDGWEARVALPPAESPHWIQIEVRLDRPRLRYVTRTLRGAGAGSEIWTTLEPRAPHETRVHVEFHLCGLPDAALPQAGAAYVELYRGLWDEDEAMMVERERVLGARRAHAPATSDVFAPVSLGARDALEAKLPLVIEVGGRRVRVVSHDGTLRAHAAECPHLGGPLDRCDVGADGTLTCPWHGWRFDVNGGRRVDADGPSLWTLAVVEDAAGEVWLERMPE